jgi:hypothetical protein
VSVALRAGAGAAVAAATAAAVVLLRRRRRPASGGRVPWSCECGRAYLVGGIDRHRVYWLPDAATEDPLLGRDCVGCGAPLGVQPPEPSRV